MKFQNLFVQNGKFYIIFAIFVDILIISFYNILVNENCYHICEDS